MLRCGRRWGKTTLLEYVAGRFAVEGQRVGWFSPQYKLNTPTFTRLRRVLGRQVASSSKIDASIETRQRGCVEFWTLSDPDAGRSRYYDLAILDEASLIPKGLRETFEQSIEPTLLDRIGSAVMAGTPKGIDPDNYFYQACTDRALGWYELHAPTVANPTLSADELERLRMETNPLVFEQEYLAQFVDWRGTAFFSEDKLLIDGAPVDPTGSNVVYAVIDTALKDGDEHDATGVVYFSKRKPYRAGDGMGLLQILDWDVISVESDLLSAWLPNVHAKLRAYAETLKAPHGWSGPWIEDKASGITLLQHARRSGMPADALPEKLTKLGKEGRALNISGHVFDGSVKLTQNAYEKTVKYRGETRNHLIAQVCGFRMGEKQAHEQDLLDCFTYGVAIGLGDSEGL